MARGGSFGARLYRGDVSYEFVGRRRLWFAISAAVILISMVALAVRGLTLGIEFRGGSEFTLKVATPSVTQAQAAVAAAGVSGTPIVTIVGGSTMQVQTEQLTSAESTKVQDSLAKSFGLSPTEVSQQFIGPSWGSQITNKAVTGLVVFLVLVVIFIWAYFREWRMAIAAIVALAHDLLITVGIYALVGFEVTPSTVIGLLTILGYSLYDTVVVFDKVRENTAGLAIGSRQTYSEAANLAVNQTLVRSINTSVIALLPVAGILFVGAGLLGAGTLKDLSLALFVGIAAGTYSSIFIATPLLAGLKEREPAMAALAKRVEARRSSESARAAEASTDSDESDEQGGAGSATPPSGDSSAAGVGAGTGTRSGPARPGPRNQPRRGQRNRPTGKRRR